MVKDDEQPLTANLEKIPSLRPAFRKDGTITAANASSISDGASALVLMTAEEAQRRGLKPLARIVGHATQSQDPSEFTLAPIGAMTNLFARTGWSKDDVDLFEINEAFAMVTMLAMREHGLDHAKVNVYGGACAQGHPVGSTGSRIILTLINALRQKGGKRGVARCASAAAKPPPWRSNCSDTALSHRRPAGSHCPGALFLRCPPRRCAPDAETPAPRRGQRGEARQYQVQPQQPLPWLQVGDHRDRRRAGAERQEIAQGETRACHCGATKWATIASFTVTWPNTANMNSAPNSTTALPWP